MNPAELEQALAAAHAENKELREKLERVQQVGEAALYALRYVFHHRLPLGDTVADRLSDEWQHLVFKILEHDGKPGEPSTVDRIMKERDEAQALLKRLAEATEVYDLWDCQREARTLLEKLKEE